MANSNGNDAIRTHFIMVSTYNKGAEEEGTKINIKALIADVDISYTHPSLNPDKLKNRVILSSKDKHVGPVTLISQQNLTHNIKFIHKNNDFLKPRIIFVKYNVTNKIVNSNKYLFADLTNINLMDVSNISNTDNNIKDIANSAYLNRLVSYFNIYKSFNNSDYYRFKFTDFIDLSDMEPGTLEDANNDKIKVTPKLVSLQNNFATNNMLNYNADDFKNLLIKDDYGGSNNKLEFDKDISGNETILLRSEFDNISTVKFDLKHDNTYIPDICINFVLNKGYVNKSQTYGKLYLTKDFTYLNARVLDYSNNFYEYNNSLDENKVYLSLGNSITGITQRDLYTKMELDIKTIDTTTLSSSNKKLGDVKKIYFSKSVIPPNIETEMLNRKYLLNEDYDYNYDSILYNNVQSSNIKIGIKQNLLDYYQGYNGELSYNIYNSAFNSFAVSKDISFDNYTPSGNKFVISDISYAYLNNRIRFNNSLLNPSNIGNALIDEIITDNEIIYDFRYNYDKTFYTDIFLTVKYEENSPLNFHKIILTSEFTASESSDFTNVDCVFIYHDPYDERTPELFRYPYNNIEISNNPNIDTLTRAIVLLPGADSSVTNTIIIPSKNGSNLSRKQIQGLIGMNNIPKLLSILPYEDENIIGRGFVNQFQITDKCKNHADRVEDKLNSQKHVSVKNTIGKNANNTTKSKNFANLVRSRGRNQIIRGTTVDCSKVEITNYTTPFTNPMWRHSR
tara:strand:- start:468 stop:2669 length:2202 start_codon:yes stop_codon:yes gene_type:complete